jgi:hypothetical protein
MSTHLPDSPENHERVRKSGSISAPRPKTPALLRMKMKFMRERRWLRRSEEENKHLKHVIEKARDSANLIGQLDIDEDDEDDDPCRWSTNMSSSRVIINELSTFLDIDAKKRRFSIEL